MIHGKIDRTKGLRAFSERWALMMMRGGRNVSYLRA